MKYILIKDNTINNIIIAEESFIELIKDDYDSILSYDEYSSKPNLVIGATLIKNLDNSIDFFLKPSDELIKDSDIIDATVIEEPVNE